MKKLFAFALVLLLLLSMAACKSAGNSIVTVYVVTEQRDYKNGELVNTATFEYDEHGRPTVVGFKKADGSGLKSELKYDKHGNLIQQINSTIYGGDQPDMVQQSDWDMTYTGDLLTRVQRQQDGYGLDFQYDKNGRLVLLQYPELKEGMDGSIWQNYEYDNEDRLIRETRCKYQGQEFIYSRVSYFYDDAGRLIEQYFSSAASDTQAAPEEMDTLSFEISPYEHYFFYYDGEGNFAYVGDGAEDTYDGGKADIYSDEKYVFDENGNLIQVIGSRGLGETEPSRTEYTYKAMELTQSDAVMHKRLIHGISNFTLGYTANNTMDPLFWAMCPSTLYQYKLCVGTFYYLIPYPQFELFLNR